MQTELTRDELTKAKTTALNYATIDSLVFALVSLYYTFAANNLAQFTLLSMDGIMLGLLWTHLKMRRNISRKLKEFDRKGIDKEIINAPNDKKEE